MYMAFTFTNGGNPCITKTNREAFRMFCKYYTVQTGARTFCAVGLREWNGRPNFSNYGACKLIAENIAQEWQHDFDSFAYSWEDLAGWGDFFAEIGKKFGLSREFRENGII